MRRGRSLVLRHAITAIVLFHVTTHLIAMAISKPFGFHEKTIEYAMGLCWHPDGKRLVISYGFKDCEARLATVDPEEVIAWLNGPK